MVRNPQEIVYCHEDVDAYIYIGNWLRGWFGVTSNVGYGKLLEVEPYVGNMLEPYIGNIGAKN